MNETLINRVYDVRVAGYDESLKNLKALTAAFNKMDETKRKTDEQLRKAVEAGNTAAVDKLTAKVKELETQLKKLDKARVESAKEVELLAKAEKLEADARLTNTKNIILQEKELDRQIALEEKRNQKQSASAKAAGTNYYALMEAQKKAVEAYRLFDASTGDSAGLEKVKQNAVEAKRAVDAFNRSLSPDGTLVGEYKTGIVNAFNQLGLGDIIRKQRNDISNQLQQVKQKNQELSVAYKKLAQDGGEAFNKIDAEIKESIELQQRLQQSLEGIDTQLKNSGSIGSQVTSSISKGFKDARNQAVQLALGYVSFQAAVSGVQKSLEEGKQLEGVQSAFNNLNRPDLLDNLRKATRGTVSDLELMKRAVSANNFQIPLEQMTTLLDFARRRAKETGQSVDYLVDSIITGIGRKSPLILDNLGISAIRLKEKLKGIAEENANVGDVAKAVGEIVAEENAKAGKEVDTNAEKVQQQEARWANLRAELGNNLIPILNAVGSVFLGIASIMAGIPFPVMISLLTAVTAGYALYRAEMVRSYIATQIANKEGLIYNAYLLLQAARTRAVALITKAATYEISLFNGAIKISPLGIFLTTLSLVVPTIALLATEAKNAKNQMNALDEVNRRASQSYAEQIGKINSWMQVITSSATSADTKKKAIEELIKIDTRFKEALSGDVILLDKLKVAYDEVTKSIQAVSRAEAAKSLAADKQKALQNIQAARQVIEVEYATQSKNSLIGFSSDKIPEDVKAILKNLNNLSFSRGLFDPSNGNFTVDQKNYKKLIQELASLESSAAKDFENYFVVQQKLEADIAKAQPQAGPTLFERFQALVKAGGTDEDFGKLLKDVQEQRSKTNRLLPEYKQLKALEKQIEDLLNPKQRSQRDVEKDPFRLVDAKRDTALANAERELLEIKKVRKATYDEELAYLNKTQGINLKALNEKLAILARKGTLNAEEKKMEAGFKKDIVDIQLKTQEQIEALNKREFDRRAKELEARLDEQKRLATQQLTDVTNNPDALPSERLKAEQEFNFKMLTLQTQHLKAMQALHDKYGVDITDVENKIAEEISKILASIGTNRRQTFEKAIQDIDELEKRMTAALNASYSKQKSNVLNGKGSTSNKKAQLEQLDLAKNIDLARIAMEQAKQRYEEAQAEFERLPSAENKKKLQEYFDLYTQKQEALNNAIDAGTEKVTSLQELLRKGLRSILGFGKGSTEEQLLTETLVKAYDFAKSAMNDYFDARRERIEQDKQLSYERIDLEKEQLLEQAQSQAERDSIERQAAAKKKEADKKAFEENKKIQLAQAKINLATQLSNLAVIAFSPNPANLATLGIAGAVMYAAQAAIAIAGYIANVNRINTAQFATGGKVNKIPGFATGGNVPQLTPGPINVTPNIPRQPNGDNVLATVKTGEVILNEEQQKRAGGPAFFGAIGVPGFASGGYTGLGDFRLGDNLQAPYNPASFLLGSSTGDMSEIKARLESNAAQLQQTRELVDEAAKAVSNIKVQVVAKEVEDTNNKTRKATSIGTL